MLSNQHSHTSLKDTFPLGLNNTKLGLNNTKKLLCEDDVDFGCFALLSILIYLLQLL